MNEATQVMHGLSAEASLYGKSGKYAPSVGKNLNNDEEMVYPQSCKWFVAARCAAKIGGCTAFCSTISGPAWIGCMAGCFDETGAGECLDCVK